MHYLLTLCFTLFCMAASAQKQPLPTYTRDWQKADSLAKKGLPQSALTIVEQIYQQAKAGGNEPQLVKAALYRLIYQPYTTEDTYVKAVRSLRQDIAAAGASAPARSVLQSVLAETYWKYYQQNRWKFYNRTAVEKPTGTDDDPLTWDLRRLVRETVAAYEASLRPADVLKKTPVSTFDVVIHKGDADARPLRPTLYDFLAHRALAFYASTEPDIVRPGLPATGAGPGLFVLNQPVYLADWKQFVATPLATTDSLSLKFRALALYQSLIVFHQSDKDPLALVDADLARLTFVYKNGPIPNKDELYQQTLEEQIRRYQGNPAEARYSLALAQLWSDLSNKSKTGNWRRKAVVLLTDLLKRLPKTGLETNNARQLLDELNQRTLRLTVEDSYEPLKPIRTSVAFRNTTAFRYRIVRVGSDEQTRRRWRSDQGETLARRYLAHPTVAEATVKLPDDGDLQEHHTEIALPALPIGHYVVLTTTDNRLAESSTQLQYTELVVTNLSYLLDQANGRSVAVATEVNYPKLYVTNRQTGKPLGNVRVQIMEMDPSSGTTKGPRGDGRPRDVFTTDAQGTIRPTSALPPNKNYQLRISTRQDTIYTESFYNYRPAPPTPNQPEIPEVLLFTDRAIYRPGQIIYFKGALYSGKENDFAVVPNRETTVTLNDVNDKVVSTLTVRSNEFGTVNGQFTAPNGRLNGSMSISMFEGQTAVRVEEYKRPTFEVVMAPMQGSYKLGQAVQVRADARTFAGAAIDGAQVRYRVVRELRQPWYSWWWRGPHVNSPRAEIANGVLTTDATGAFSITFPAQPDLAVDQATKPIFDFAITFDVTDRSGETRSANRTLGIGYSAIKATLTLPEQVENRDQRIGLSISNAGGERVNTTGTLTIYPLDAPRQPLRKRRWQEPDRFALTRDAFKKLFPNDVYDDEDQLAKWPRRPAAAQVSFDKTRGDSLLLPLSRIPAGVYAAEVIATDSTGESVTQTDYFTVVTPERPVLTALPDGWVRAMQTEVKPGSPATFWLASEAPVYVLMQVLSHRGVESARWITLNKPGQPVRVDVPVVAAWKDQFTVAFTKVQAGELLQESKFITVSARGKQLTVETLTFRDKLKPGQPEEWTLRISGPEKEKVLAEAVATLYDASLDSFVKLNWSTRSEYMYQPAYHLVPNWSRAIFGDHTSSFFRYDNQPVYSYLARSYDALVGDGEGAVISLGGRNRASAPMLKSAMSMDYAVAASPKEEEIVELSPAIAAEKVPNKDTEPAEESPSPRRNFNETAFFFPTLHTDEQGRVLLKFTMPEALTRWRLLLFAHTKDMKIGSLERTVVTQKELMITANAPRFLREGDTLRLAARINNLSGKALSGSADLLLTDAQTGKPLTLVNVKSAATNFTLSPGLSTAVGWTFVVPVGLEAVTYRVTARSGQFTDGEEQTLPVLPNRMLMTDTQPFYLNGAGTKEITLPALTKQNPELPFDPERLTVELTATPVWTALQSLPYLADYPYECAEQLFSRFYANTLAAQIVQAKPEIRTVVERWQKEAPSNPLEANAELKSVTLDETPWRRSARTQQEQQAQLGRFLDDDQLRAGRQEALQKLRQLQLADGGFTWFAGMPVDPTVTIHILAGLGHLNKLGVTSWGDQQALVQTIQSEAVRFADAQARQWIERQKQSKSQEWSDYWPVQYLYARSFYVGQSPIDKAILAAMQNGITQNWLKQSIQGQAMTALALHRLGDRQTPAAILKSLRERAAQSNELGMYWPANKPGYFWQQAPIETQALLIEAFEEIAGDRSTVNAMKQWLLSQKRTQAWPSTKATTEAIYALLLRGDDWLDTKPGTELSIGGKRIDKTPEGVTGYQKITYAGADVKPALGVVTVAKSTNSPSWGGIYYQHFLPLDQVPNSTGDLSVTKTFYLRRDTPNGPTLSPVTAQTTLKPGDEIVVRLIVRNDRDMQYVHLKDSRASGFEPVTALSGYKFQNGLSYYEAPRDASTDFYLSYLAAGTHVFEYPLRAFHAGDFSSGVATVQCFYAPEFSAHSTGGWVKVGEGK